MEQNKNKKHTAHYGILAAVVTTAVVLTGCTDTETYTPARIDTDHEMKHAMEHDHELYEVPEGVEAPTVEVVVEEDEKSGWNVQIQTTNFAFTPENVNGDNVDGEGHAHIYVDGEKVGRVYGEWYHLGELGKGEHEIEVELNTNDHSPYAVDGERVMTTIFVEEGEGSHTHDEEDEDHMMEEDMEMDEEVSEETEEGEEEATEETEE